MPTSVTRILIVEDNPLTAAIMSIMVGDLGYLVIGPTLNLNDGLDHANEDEIDFALLDFDLGNGTDATPIAETLLARHVPFAFTTASDADMLRRLFGQVQVVGKPIREADLRQLLPT